ncbi:YrdB family protein [Nocardia stercoris]|nr:YrdB family protein [Nocardia stercoris]
MSELWKWGNLTLAFVMELVALGALGLWGWKVSDTLALKIGLAVGVPLAAAVAWGLFAAPQAAIHGTVIGLVVKVVVFGGAALGLWAAHYRTAAVVFAVVLVGNLLAIKLGHLAV